jgi:hypothetical protein
MPEIILNCRQNGRRRLGRPLKKLFDEAETGLSRPNARRMMNSPMIHHLACLNLSWMHHAPLKLMYLPVEMVQYSTRQSESYLLRCRKIQILRDSFVRLACLINYLAVGLYDSYVTDSANFFFAWILWLSLVPMCQHIPVLSILLFPVTHVSATSLTTGKEMSRNHKRRSNAGTQTGSSSSRPLNIARKSGTRVNVISHVAWSFRFSPVIKSRRGD